MRMTGVFQINTGQTNSGQANTGRANVTMVVPFARPQARPPSPTCCSRSPISRGHNASMSIARLHREAGEAARRRPALRAIPPGARDHNRGAGAGIPKQIDHIAFKAKNLRAIAERLRSADVKFFRDLHDGMYGLTIYIADPDGTMIELYEEGERMG
jgi:Glyoxalase/Bleomycin resistance protein/Dioxygenase superfamily